MHCAWTSNYEERKCSAVRRHKFMKVCMLRVIASGCLALSHMTLRLRCGFKQYCAPKAKSAFKIVVWDRMAIASRVKHAQLDICFWPLASVSTVAVWYFASPLSRFQSCFKARQRLELHDTVSFLCVGVDFSLRIFQGADICIAFALPSNVETSSNVCAQYAHRCN